MKVSRVIALSVMFRQKNIEMFSSLKGKSKKETITFEMITIRFE